MRSIILIFTLILIRFNLLATTYHSFSIDASGNSFSSDEIVVVDSISDSLWLNNEIENLYITWDTNYFYFGCDYKISENALLIVFNFGVGDGKFDISDLKDLYPRNFRFAGVLAEFMLANWNAESDNLMFLRIRSDSHINRPETITANLSINSVQESGVNKAYLEAKVDWNNIYGLGTGRVKIGAEVYVVVILCGGDGANGGDAAPDNPEAIRGGTYKGTIRRYFYIKIDSDNNGVPDKNISPKSAGKIVEFPVEVVKIENLKIIPYCFNPFKSDTDISFVPTENGYVDIEIYNEAGEFIRRLAERVNVEKNQQSTFVWDGRDFEGNIVPFGIYIVNVLLNDRVQKKDFIIVVR